MIKAKKLRGGPGIRGKMQPARPTNARSSPRIITIVIEVAPLFDSEERTFSLKLQQKGKK